jgi:hypothetical protein
LGYQRVKDYIIQLVQKSFRNGKDVAAALRKMEKIDMTKHMPTRNISQETGADKRSRNKKDSTCYTKQRSISIPREDMNLRITSITYSLIFLQHCNKTI